MRGARSIWQSRCCRQWRCWADLLHGCAAYPGRQLQHFDDHCDSGNCYDCTCKHADWYCYGELTYLSGMPSPMLDSRRQLLSIHS